ncbi:MAG: hypothetical protein H6Q72_4183 [Firmicutes bacterium]|nr:hypothetical protein [Bacillota bacterium]
MSLKIYIYGDRSLPVIQECKKTVEEFGAIIVDETCKADLAIAPLLTQKLSSREIRLPKLGTLIFHPSLLPRHRGPDAIRWAFALGEKYSGVTWFWADEGLDTGDICEQEVLAIREGEKPRAFYSRAVIPAATRTLKRVLQLLSRGVIRRVPQLHEDATYEYKRA